MNIDQLKTLLRSNGLKPNFTYGQNFLIDDIVLQDMVDAAEVTQDDVVVEIGPGIGNLTKLLCERAGFVLSVEKDPKFLPILKAIKKNHKENFRYEFADALEFDFEKYIESANEANLRMTTKAGAVPPLFFKEGVGGSSDSEHSDAIRSFGSAYKLVANIPYYITGKILKMFMTAKNKPTSITVLTQKEVAQNVTAGVGDLSILAISVQLYGEPKLIQIVPARSFYPMPKVDSAVLQIKLYDKPKYILADEKKFFRVVKSCFAGKRKQIHNTLVNNLHLDKTVVTKILSELKIPLAARPQELSIDEWIKLSEKI